MDKEQRDEFTEWLALPLTNRKRQVTRAPAPTRADLESEGDDFMAFMGAHAAG